MRLIVRKRLKCNTSIGSHTSKSAVQVELQKYKVPNHYNGNVTAHLPQLRLIIRTPKMPIQKQTAMGMGSHTSKSNINYS